MSAVCIGFIEAGSIEFGHWCPDCLLPSVVRVEVLLVTDNGVTSQGHMRLCSDCRHEAFE